MSGDWVKVIGLCCGGVSFLEGEGMEKTCRIKQRDISEAVDVASASKVCNHLTNFLVPSHCYRYLI